MESKNVSPRKVAVARRSAYRRLRRSTILEILLVTVYVACFFFGESPFPNLLLIVTVLVGADITLNLFLMEKLRYEIERKE